MEWSGLLGGSRLEGLARFLGCSKCWRWVQRSVARTTREPLYRRLHSEPVETAVCAIILAQSAVVGFGAQEAYDAQFNGAAPKVGVWGRTLRNSQAQSGGQEARVKTPLMTPPSVALLSPVKAAAACGPCESAPRYADCTDSRRPS